MWNRQFVSDCTYIRDIVVDRNNDLYISTHISLSRLRDKKTLFDTFNIRSSILGPMAYNGKNKIYIYIHKHTNLSNIIVIDLDLLGYWEFLFPRWHSNYTKVLSMKFDGVNNLYLLTTNKLLRINLNNRKSEVIIESGLDHPQGLVINGSEIYINDYCGNCLYKLCNSSMIKILSMGKKRSFMSLDRKYSFIDHPSLLMELREVPIRRNKVPRLMLTHDGYVYLMNLSDMTLKEQSIYRDVNRILSIAQCNRGYIYIGTEKRLMRVIPIWYYIRLIWIGRMKEGEYCYLSKLPNDIIKFISTYLGLANDT